MGNFECFTAFLLRFIISRKLLPVGKSCFAHIGLDFVFFVASKWQSLYVENNDIFVIVVEFLS